MTPQEVAELSRLLDEALALEGDAQTSWLDEIARSRPEVARRLRKALSSGLHRDATALPELANLEPDDTVARAGERVGSYQLIREIGRGGMGSVWLAERADGAFKRNVALKLPRLTWAAGLGKRMAREREIGALLEHPSIARLYDAGVDERGRPFIAMEYIDGRPIDAYRRENALDLRARLKLFLEVIRAVAYAHGRLVLHRDLKPANVLVDAGGHVHLLDFGIAKLLDDAEAGADLTQEQGRVLTLNYASPEQIAGRALGVTADVYALGVMLYELLTGTLPYSSKRNTAAAMEEAILAGDAPLASSRVADKRLRRELSGDLDAIVGQAIKRDPAMRYATADAFAADIGRYLDGRPITARPDSTWYRLRKTIVRQRLPLAALLGVLVVALIGAAATFVQGRRAVAEAERTQLATAFVSELFRISAAYASQTDQSPLTPEARIERGAQLIEERFAKQPEMKAEMYGTVARVYADLGVDRLASEYASRQLLTLQQQKADGERVAKAQLLLAKAALAAHRHKDAEEYAHQALQSLPHDSAFVPDALALLAHSKLLNGKDAEARQTMTEARRLLADRGANDSVALSWLLYVEALLLTRQGKFAETNSIIDQAIEQALKVEGPLSRTAIEIRLDQAFRLIARGRPDEGRVMRDAALSALQKSGGTSELRAAIATAELQFALSGNGYVPLQETLAVLRKLRTSMNTSATLVPAEVRAQIDHWYGVALMKSGDIAAGVPLLLLSADVLAGLTQDLWWQLVIADGRGEAYSIVGDYVAADKAYRQVLRIREEQGLAKSGITIDNWLSVAGNLTMQGRFQEAEAFLSAVPRLEPEPSWPPQEALLSYEKVYAKLEAGDAAGALELLPKNDPDDLLATWAPRVLQLRGEVLCAAGDRSAGLDFMRRAIGDLVSKGENTAYVARARASAGLCALALGQRQQAEELAASARKYFEWQPGVSLYYKKPLAELEKRLGQPIRPARL